MSGQREDAGLNAILNRNSADLAGCNLYTTLYPCNECAKAIIQSGAYEVVFLSDKHRDSVGDEAARTLFRLAGVTTRRFAEPLSVKLDAEG